MHAINVKYEMQIGWGQIFVVNIIRMMMFGMNVVEK